MTSVVLVADTGELALFDDTFGAKYNFRIELKTNSYDKALDAVDKFKNPVVVVRVKSPDAVRSFVTKLVEKKINFVGICEHTRDGFAMLGLGAAGMMTRSKHELSTLSPDFEHLLSTKIKAAYQKYFVGNTRVLKHEYPGGFKHIIAIGSSTGGTELILNVLKKFPANSPPILIVQHMPPVFTRLYAERMHEVCAMSVWEAKDGDALKRGLALVAPGDLQMTLEKENGVYRVACRKGALVSGHCPSVDVLFGSVAKTAGAEAVGLILTGMGKDGAEGLLSMRRSGAMTFGQDEATSVVYGMPKVAYDMGAVVKQVSANEIAGAVIDYCERGA